MYPIEHWVQKEGESRQLKHPLLQGRHCRSWEGDKIVINVVLGHCERHCEYEELIV